MVINKEFNDRYDVNELIRRIFEAGLVTKWHHDIRRVYEKPTPSIGSPYVRFEQLSGAFVFLLLSGWSLAILTFMGELIVQWRVRDPKAARVWTYLAQFFDGKRHYFTDLPRKLRKSRRHKKRSRKVEK